MRRHKKKKISAPRNRAFSAKIQRAALLRQKYRCASCGTRIARLGKAGRVEHAFGEIANAHHIVHAKFGGTNSVDNCAIICEACHYSVHEGGNYRYGTVVGTQADFAHFNG